MGYMAEIYWRNAMGMIRRVVFIDCDFNAVRKAAKRWIEETGRGAHIIDTTIHPYTRITADTTPTKGVVPHYQEGSTDAELLGLRY